jgi:hypothetical protein
MLICERFLAMLRMILVPERRDAEPEPGEDAGTVAGLAGSVPFCIGTQNDGSVSCPTATAPERSISLPRSVVAFGHLWRGPGAIS